MKNPILLLLAIFSIMPSFSTERDTTVIFMGHRTKRFFQWSGKMGERL